MPPVIRHLSCPIHVNYAEVFDVFIFPALNQEYYTLSGSRILAGY